MIRPAKLWCDTSTAEECALLRRRLGGARAAIRSVGLDFLPGYTAPKILWLKRHEPRNYRRLRHVLLPHDYLNYYLTGNFRMEFGDASGTALLEVRRRVWSAAAIRAIDPRLADWLPPLGSSDGAAGVLRADRARDYGFGPDVVVSAGGGDNMMGAIGTGNVRPGIVTASFGTSGTIYAYSARPVVDPAGEIAAFCSSTGGWLPLLCTMNVTGVTEGARALFGYDHAALDAAVAAVPAGAGGAPAPSLPHRGAHPQRPRGFGRPAGPGRGESGPGRARPGGDGGGDPGHELRPAPAGRARGAAQGNPGDGRRRPLAGLAPADGGCFRRPGRGDGGRGGGRSGRGPPGCLVLRAPRGQSARPPGGVHGRGGRAGREDAAAPRTAGEWRGTGKSRRCTTS